MGKTQSSLVTIFFILFNLNLNAQYTWVQKNNFGGMVRYAVASFVVGNHGYFVTGCNYPANVTYNDNWEYDPVSDSWTQKASLNGVSRFGASGFAIGNFGYVGCGWTSILSPTYLKDFHKYDPVNNTWSNIPDFPGNPRYEATGISDGLKGYVGLGYAPMYSDFYSYDPNANSWSAIATFPGGAREAASTFCINGIIYVCGGGNLSSSLNDLWAYDPAINTWTLKAPIPGPSRNGSIGFALNGKGFVGSGFVYPSNYNNDFYIYDPNFNSWTIGPTWTAPLRIKPGGIVINNEAYIGCGFHIPTNIAFNDIWSLSNSKPVINLSASDTTFCEKHCIDFTDLSTNNPTSWQWFFPGADTSTSSVQNPTNICYNQYGSFDVTLIACNSAGCDTLVLPGFINVYQTLTPTITQSNDTLFSSGGVGYQWWSVDSGINAGATNNYFVPTQGGSYYVIVTDSNGCEGASNTIVITGVEEARGKGLPIAIAFA